MATEYWPVAYPQQAAASGWDEPDAEVRLVYGGATYSGFIVDRRLQRGAWEALVAFFCLVDNDPTPRRLQRWVRYDELTLVE